MKGTNRYLWLRSASSDDDGTFYRVDTDGSPSYQYSNYATHGVSPAFRIG